MEIKHSRTTGKNITAFALSATLATAGLGLGGLFAPSPAWADESAEATATADAPAESADTGATTPAAEATAQVFPTATPITNTQTVTIELTNDVTTASALYDAVNAARAEQGLAPLTRDSSLERVAYQRAAESVVLATDVRPDGTAVDTLSNAVKVTGETLVAGTTETAGTAELALTAAQATTDGTANALSATHTTMGAALVRDAAGAFHWALVYSDAASTEQPTDANPADGQHTYALTVPASCVTPSGSAAQELKVEVGATAQLAPGVRLQGSPFAGDTAASEATAALKFDETQPLALAAGSATWTSADPAIASVDAKGVLTGVADGMTQVSATSADGVISATWNVTVGTGQATAPAEPAASESGDSATTDQPAEGGDTATTPETPGESTGTDEPAASEKVDLADAQVLGITEVTANPDGVTPVEPTFSLATPDGSPVPETDYTYAFSNNVEPGTATLTITAAPDSNLYTGTLVYEFTIDPAPRTNIADVVFVAPIEDQVFTGAPIEPKPAVALTADGTPLTEGVDYTYSYEANDALGTGSVIITGQGAYEGTITQPFNIVEPAKVDLSEAGATIDAIEPQAHTGEAVEPAPVVKLPDGTVLTAGTDYTVSYANNIAAGENSATVTVSGTGAYVGTLTQTFSIVEQEQPAAKQDISSATVDAIADQEYTGAAIEPSPVVKLGETTLVAGTDYTLAYANNIEAGEATVTITGTGAYEGTLAARFAIVKPELINLRTAGFSIADIPDQKLGESAPQPTVTVSDGTTTLVAGTDYTVSYERNDAPGMARIVVTGTGAYTGVIDKAFRVVSGEQQLTSIKGAQLSSLSAQSFTGGAIEPALTVTLNGKTLTAGTDYEVTYENNVNVGTARVVVTGIGSYEGTLETTFVINALSLTQVEIVMPNQYATGSALEPSPVSVTAPSGYELVQGTDYDIVGYVNNTSVGKAGVTLSGKGNFTGKVTAAFQIVEKGTQEAGTTNTLPKTGDATNIAPVVIAGVAGVALVGAGAALVMRRRREN